MTENNILLIGGDLRQLHAGNELMKHGYKIYHYALDTYKESCELSDTLKNADAILLPVPVFRGDYMNFPLSSVKLSPRVLASEIVKNAKPDTVVFGGKFPSDMTAIFDKSEIRYHDLCENETFNYLNAVPTAEGALALAMQMLRSSIFGAYFVVMGYGRIGAYLAKILGSLGGKVTIVARNAKSRTLAEISGFDAVGFDDCEAPLTRADMVFNTVPEKIFGERELSAIRSGRTIIDLAR